MRKTAFIGIFLALALPATGGEFLGSQQAKGPRLVKPKEKPAPPTPMALQKAELGDDETWDPAWDKVVEDALPTELLFSSKVAKDVQPFCPRYRRMSEPDRRVYWAYFFQALAGAEAGLRATADVQHSEPEVAVKDSVTHRMVRSEGLMQVTYQDADRYGCDFDWEADKNLPAHSPEKTILQPENNLQCGVKILTYQLLDKQKPLVTHSSYWSTLRPGWPGYSTFLKQMSNVPAACGREQSRTRATQSVETANSQSMSASPGGR